MPAPTSLRNLRAAFTIPDLRNKILFTLFIIAIYRLGDNIIAPGVDFNAVQSLEAAARNGGVISYLNLFSGGALTKLAVFGLGIMPYITASIIVQLLMVVIPKFEQWRDEGPSGQRKLTQVTRYMTIALAIMQSTGLAYAFHNGGGGLLGHLGAAQRGPHPRLHRPPCAPDRDHIDGGHGRGHVAGRADNAEGRRPGHVGADLHQRDRRLASHRETLFCSRPGRPSSPSCSCWRWSSWWPSSLSKCASGAYRSRSPREWWAGECTAARARIYR